MGEGQIPEDLFTLHEENLLDAIIYPMTKKEFNEKIYAKKALVVRNQPKGRFQHIIEQDMYNLDIESLLSEQALGNNFDVWYPPNK